MLNNIDHITHFFEAFFGAEISSGAKFQCLFPVALQSKMLPWLINGSLKAFSQHDCAGLQEL